jgi:hypothetical protein
MLRNGVPIHIVQAQLAHWTAKLTSDSYGAFIPRSEDRTRAEAQATRAEAERAAARASEGLTSICRSKQGCRSRQGRNFMAPNNGRVAQVVRARHS